MPTDLTRFDFHVLRFMKSLDVMAMTDAEVGQYILLLSESWLIGDDCTLPDNVDLLARLARTEEVSPLVLKKFPVTDTKWGHRRRNTILYAEWLNTLKRSDDGRKAVQSRPDRSTEFVRPYNDRTTNDVATMVPKPSQANSNQAEPNQESHDIHTITRKYRAAIGKSHSRSKFFAEKYETACRQFGEDAVIAEFEDWAESNKWRKDSLGNSGLRFFFSDLPEMIEESAAVHKMEKSAKAETAESDSAAQAAILLGREAGRQEFERRHAEVEAENEQAKELPVDQF